MANAMFAGYDIEGLVKKANELQADADRLRDVIWKLEKQLDEVGKMSNRQRGLLKRCASVIDAYSPNHPLLEDIEEELADA